MPEVNARLESNDALLAAKYSSDEVSLSRCSEADGTAGEDFDYTLDDNNPYSSAFGDNETKLYMVGNETDSIHQYNLPAARNIDLAAPANVYDLTPDVPTTDPWPTGIAFNNDGSKVFITLRAGDVAQDFISSWSLSTPWDTTTMSHITDYDVTADGLPNDGIDGLYIHPDGDVALVISDDDLYRYTMSTPFDISTLSLDGTVGTGVYFGRGGITAQIFNDHAKVTTCGDVSITEYTMEPDLSLGTFIEESDINYSGKYFDEFGYNTPSFVSIMFSETGCYMYLTENNRDTIVEWVI